MKQLISNIAKGTVLSVALLTTPFVSHAADKIVFDFNQLLNEQRAWAGLSTKTATVEGIKWVYSEGGDPSKPTILLVHGISGSRDHWNMVAQKLTPFYHVVIPDLPGHGDTESPADYSYDMTDITTSLRRFTEHLKIEKNMHIAGHSLGGIVAGLYSSMYFSDTQSLLLVDTAGVYKTVQSDIVKNPTKAKEMMVTKPGDLQRLMKYTMSQPPFIPKLLLDAQEQAMIATRPKLEKLVNKLIEMAGSYTPEAYAISVKAVEAPTLLIWGEKDQLFPPSAVSELTPLLKNEQPPVILENIGHVPILEADQLVAQHYLKFLTGAGAVKNKFATP